MWAVKSCFVKERELSQLSIVHLWQETIVSHCLLLLLIVVQCFSRCFWHSEGRNKTHTKQEAGMAQRWARRRESGLTKRQETRLNHVPSMEFHLHCTEICGSFCQDDSAYQTWLATDIIVHLAAAAFRRLGTFIEQQRQIFVSFGWNSHQRFSRKGQINEDVIISLSFWTIPSSSPLSWFWWARDELVLGFCSHKLCFHFSLRWGTLSRIKPKSTRGRKGKCGKKSQKCPWFAHDS